MKLHNLLKPPSAAANISVKPYSQIIFLLTVASIMSACSSITAPTQEFTTQLTPIEQASAPEPQPTPAEKYHSLDTRTGIAEIDTVLVAVESGDAQEVRDLFHYTTTACMTVNALGGPPPCREGEAEGMLVEVLPILGPEGSYLWKDEVGSWLGLEVTGLYAVYQVSDSAYSDEYYSKGDYGIILVGGENKSDIVLQVSNEGIVRIDYPTALDEILARGASEVILAPKE